MCHLKAPQHRHLKPLLMHAAGCRQHAVMPHLPLPQVLHVAVHSHHTGPGTVQLRLPGRQPGCVHLLRGAAGSGGLLCGPGPVGQPGQLWVRARHEPFPSEAAWATAIGGQLLAALGAVARVAAWSSWQANACASAVAEVCALKNPGVTLDELLQEHTQQDLILQSTADSSTHASVHL